MCKKEAIVDSSPCVKNEISLRYDDERKQAEKKRLKRGCIDEIITNTKQKNLLPAECVIDKCMIRQRQKRNVFVLNPHAGHSSPLSSAEPDIIATLIQMDKMRHSLTPSQSLKLINSMIRDSSSV
mmetsp:Transcript_12989/g.15242  ORF Transcript_12989/g.15242 Transcript_12989/m.15242 type:complete len:125 (-) Transcript_12989:809-1183(-)